MTSLFQSSNHLALSIIAKPSFLLRVAVPSAPNRLRNPVPAFKDAAGRRPLPCFACENVGANGDHHISPDPNCTHCRKSDPSPSSLYSSSSLGYVSATLSDSEKLRRVVTASINGFTIGAGLKGGLAIFSILALLRRRKLLASLRTEGVITNNEAIVTALKETLRYGLFLGTFAGTFISVDEIIGSLAGHRSSGQPYGGLWWQVL